MIKIRLSKIQLFLIMFILQTGVVFVTSQSGMVRSGGRDAWLIFLCSSVLFYFQLFLYEKNYQYFEIGRFLTWMYEIYWLVTNVMIIFTVTHILQIWAFPNTPKIVLVSMMVLVSFYANLGRPETILNLAVPLLPLILLFVVFLTLPMDDLVWDYLFPIGSSSPKQWLKGLMFSQVIFAGAEVFLFLRKYIYRPERPILKHITWYWVIFTTFMTFSMIVVQTFMSVGEIKIVPQATLYILKSQQVRFVERLDMIFLYIWLIWSIITFAIFAFMKIFIYKLSYSHKKRTINIFCHLLMIILPLYLIQEEYMRLPSIILPYGHILFSMIIPLVVILKGRWKSRK